MEFDRPLSRVPAAAALAAASISIAAALVVGRGDPEAMALGVLAALIFVSPLALRAPRLPQKRAYRAAMGLAIATTFILFWAIGATSFMGTDDAHPNDLMYVVVPIVGIVGASLARLQPEGMARALIATAIAQMLVPVLVMIAGLNLVPISVSELIWFTLMVNGPFAALYLGSAVLFRKAAREQLSSSARSRG